MSVLFQSDKLYPKNKVNAADYSIQGYLEVTANLAYNPVKVALAAYKTLGDADLLWLVNNIQDPYTQLHEGLLLQIPMLTAASSVAIKKSVAETVNVKNAKIAGQKIVY